MEFWLHTFKLMVAVYMRIAAASSQRMTHTSFQHMTGQALESHHHIITNGTLHNLEACALLCVKDENCKAFSYQEETRVFHLSSAFPVIAANIGEHEASLSEAFMKVETWMNLTDGGSYLHSHHVFPYNAELSTHHHVSIEACASRCFIDTSCYGFCYKPSLAACDLLMSKPDVNSARVGKSLAEIYYLIIRAASERSLSNIARDKPASQSSDYYNHNADYGVNGVYTDYSSTKWEIWPYWLVNLGSICTVSYIKVFNYVDWIDNYPVWNPVVYVGLTEEITYKPNNLNTHPSHLNHPVCDYLEGGIQLDNMEFTCQPSLVGSVVFIDSYDGGSDHYLYFAELEVFGYC